MPVEFFRANGICVDNLNFRRRYRYFLLRQPGLQIFRGFKLVGGPNTTRQVELSTILVVGEFGQLHRQARFFHLLVELTPQGVV